MKNFKELFIWRKGIELVKETYLLSKLIPDSERFGLISQMTRAAAAIPANIAEGSGRNSDKDYSRFLDIALGSAFELQTYFVIARETEWINQNTSTKAETLVEEEIKMIHAFLKSLKKVRLLPTFLFRVQIHELLSRILKIKTQY